MSRRGLNVTEDLPEPTAGSGQAGAHGGRADAEDAGDLARRELLPDGQGEHLPVELAQPGEGRAHVEREITAVCGYAVALREVVTEGMAEPLPAHVTAPVVGQDLAGDAVQPEAGLVAGRQVVDPSPRDQEAVGHDVGRVRGLGDPTEGIGEQRVQVDGVEPGEVLGMRGAHTGCMSGHGSIVTPDLGGDASPWIGNRGETPPRYRHCMAYLLRVELPDVPGSLGRLASAIGSAGGNIDAIEIVERTPGRAIDDVFLAAETNVMPDSIVSACTALEDVRVLWISRYMAGSNLTRDLEVVEEMTTSPERAVDMLVDLLPATLVVDWAARLASNGTGIEVKHGTPAAPGEIPAEFTWPDEFLHGARYEVPEKWSELLVAGTPLGDEIIVIARRGGPPILDSEIARLTHLTSLARSITRTG